jgi:hypothetical protein
MLKTLLRRRVAVPLLALGLIAGSLPFADAAVNYAATVATGRLNVVAALINSQTLAAPTGTATAGQLVVGTSALSGSTGILVTIPLAAPCCTVSGKTLTLAGTPLSSNPTTSGTAALAEIRNNAGTTIASGLTVGLAGSGAGGTNPDIVVNTATVATGVPFTVNSGVINHP